MWAAHAGHVVVGNGEGGFNEKLTTATAAVLTIAKQAHPDQWDAAHARQAGGPSPQREILERVAQVDGNGGGASVGGELRGGDRVEPRLAVAKASAPLTKEGKRVQATAGADGAAGSRPAARAEQQAEKKDECRVA